MKRLLITGAAGNLGSLARWRLGHLAQVLRLSDIDVMPPARANEEVVPCDLTDFSAVCSLSADCDGIVHLGGRSTEDKFPVILNANIIGTYNLYEAAHRAGVTRVLFASSNHVTGYYKRETRLNANAVPRPDSMYGVSKCFGEALANLYYDKFGLESAIVRIGSCFPEPRDHRMLSTWLSPDDFVRLVERVFTTRHLGCTVVYGVSANNDVWWDNDGAVRLGWTARDSSERFREQLDARLSPPAPTEHAAIYQGGGFVSARHNDDD